MTGLLDGRVSGESKGLQSSNPRREIRNALRRGQGGGLPGAKAQCGELPEEGGTTGPQAYTEYFWFSYRSVQTRFSIDWTCA